MTENAVRTQYRNLLNDIDFEKLELEFKKPNIFQVLKVSRAELRHSNFLAWLFDPVGSHGLGKYFLTKFLRDIATSNIKNDLDEFEIESLNFNNVELRREWKSIDLLIIFDDLVVCLENKVDSHDHSGQLSKYRNIVNRDFPKHKQVFVYLTPAGEQALDIEERDHFATYSYKQLVEHGDRVLSIQGNSINSAVFQYLSDYFSTLKRELMMTDESNQLANMLYKNHRELFDFVFENKSDLSTEILPLFEKKILDSGWVLGSPNKGYARFLTTRLDKIIPRKGVGWQKKESFLFEIDFFWYKKKAVFKTVISPGNDAISKILDDALKKVEGFKKPKGKKWLVHFQLDWPFDTEKLTAIDHEDILENIDKVWHKLTEIVLKVEAEIVNIEEELVLKSNSNNF